MTLAGTLRGLLAALCWVTAHFLLYVSGPWRVAPFEGEWDVLLTAKAFAAGEVLPVAAGSIHGFEVGSYLTAAVAAVPLLFGADPTWASRLVAAGIGAAGVGAAAWGAANLLPADRAGERNFVAAAVAVLASFCFPQWHWLNVGITGTSIEAAVLLVPATLLAASAERSSGRSAAVGALMATALLYSPVALVGVPLLLWLLFGGDRTGRGERARWWAGGFAVPVVLAALLPGGPTALLSVGYSWSNLAAALFAGQGAAGAFARGGAWAPLAWLGSMAPGGFFDGRGAVAAVALAGAIPVAAGVSAWRGTPAPRRVGLAALYWLGVLSVVFLRSDGFPEVYRYWAVYDLLGICCLALLLAELSRRALRLAPAALALLGLVGTLRAAEPLPPPHRGALDVMLSLGGHRTTERLGVGRIASDRHGTFAAVLPQVPAAHAAAFAQAYGVSVADDLSEPGLIPWWPEWELARLRSAVDEATWRQFLMGLGCGLVAQDRLDAERMRLLDELTGTEWDSVYWGAGACSEGQGEAGFGRRVAAPTEAGAVACYAGGAGAGCSESGVVVPGLWRYAIGGAARQ